MNLPAKPLLLLMGLLLVVMGVGIIAMPQAIIFGTGPGHPSTLKLEMADSVILGEPIAATVWLDGNPDYMLPQNSQGYYQDYFPACTIAYTENGVRANVGVQKAYANINPTRSDVPVVVNGVQNLDLAKVDKEGNQRFSFTSPAAAKDVRLMDLTIGAYLTSGTHTLTVEYPCVSGTDVPGSESYVSFLTNTWIGTALSCGSGYRCAVSKTFTVGTPQSMQFSSTTNTTSNLTGESFTTTHVTTEGSTVTQIISNSTPQVGPSFVLRDVEQATTATGIENKTVTTVTGGGSPLGLLQGGGYKTNWFLIVLGGALILLGWKVV